MQANTTRWLTCRPVASALVGLLALGTLAVLPSRETVARETTALGALSGQARVVDGDTLEVDGERVRLEGIDAPESAQTCRRGDGKAWPCGKAAAKALERLVAGGSVSCEDRGTDKYGRTLGICSAGGRDINAEMVREGFAWAFVKYSQSYVAAEAQARAQRAGIWQGEAEPAWDYRAKAWAGAEDTAPQGCAIKGNVTANGRIYHMPWSPWYGKVKVDALNGERWFCSEADAVAAGWRPAAVH
jgi:endonuclease YncB( thermonuclease family)